LTVSRIAIIQKFLIAIPCLLLPAAGFSSSMERIKGSVAGGPAVVLRGNVPRQIARAVDRGPLDAATRVSGVRLILKPSVEQQAALDQLLEDQRNPGSPDYQNWLTPEQFGERFGVSENDIGKLTAWLESQGLRVEEVARARNFIAFSGTASQVSAAFRVELRNYELEGERHFANAGEPSVPAALRGVVEGIRGLNDFHPKPYRTQKLRPAYTSGSAHYLSPDDLATIYDVMPLYQAGFDGTGQKLVIPGQSDINLADIRAFRSQFGLSANDPQLVLAGKDPGVNQNDQIESELDVEWAGAVARNATIVFVYSQNVFTSIQYAIDQNLAPVISLSYGACESGVASNYRSLAQQANAQGITWLSASGDSGAAGCDAQGSSAAASGPAVTFPADIPEVTAVGGTEFADSGSTGWSSSNSSTWLSATGYIPEKAWNDTAATGRIEGSGGGASVLFAKPWWQTGPGVPNDKARDVPDVSLTASRHDGYIIYYGGKLASVGGTSASTPSFAGMVTLLNQYLVTKGVQSKPGVGNINPNLYSLAQSTPSAFHDITTGDNIVPCEAGSTGCPPSGSFGYTTGDGYDLVTGLGSVDANVLVTKWAASPAGVGTSTSVTALPTSILTTGSTTLTAKVAAVSGSDLPTGAVTFSLGSTSLGSASVLAGVATVSVKGPSLAVGSNTITAAFTASGNFSNSSGTVSVTVTPMAVATAASVAANPASILTTGTTR
jgi:subtilase family serine protease